MDRGFDIRWVWGQNTMGRGFDIPWVGGSKYHGYGGGQYTMGVKIPYDTGPFLIHDLSPGL